MFENSFAREYLIGLFDAIGKSPEEIIQIASISGIEKIDDPLLEISFLRQGGSAVRGFNLAITMLAMCKEDTPIALIAKLVEAVEECNWKLADPQEELPELRTEAMEDPSNGEKLAQLGFGLNALDEREAALTAFTNALENPGSLCIDCHRDCLNNIGWYHYSRGEYEQALGWFEHACRLKEPAKQTDEKHLGDEDESESARPYRLALENVLLSLTKLGRLTEATVRLEEYHDWFGRLPRYESTALEKLGLHPDVIFIRSRTRQPAV